MAGPTKKNKEDPYDPINRRLDALIRILLETLYDKKDKKFNEGTAARALNSAGLTPTEIARIMGKKDATSVAPYLYSKGKGKSAVKEPPSAEEGEADASV